MSKTFCYFLLNFLEAFDFFAQLFDQQIILGEFAGHFFFQYLIVTDDLHPGNEEQLLPIVLLYPAFLSPSTTTLDHCEESPLPDSECFQKKRNDDPRPTGRETLLFEQVAALSRLEMI